jgi:hypothetical protein
VVEIKPKPSPNYQQEILEPIEFEFKDIKIKTEKTEATINWSTTLPSDSRLVIQRDGLMQDIFPSNTSNSFEHTVNLYDLDYRSRYTYELIAEEETNEISRFGSFYTEGVILKTIEKEENEDDCYIFLATNTDGKPFVGEDYIIHAGTSLRTYPRTVLTTDKNGEFEYCENIDNLRIVDSENEEVYSL